LNPTEKKEGEKDVYEKAKEMAGEGYEKASEKVGEAYRKTSSSERRHESGAGMSRKILP
jgi:hypothetical protein